MSLWDIEVLKKGPNPNAIATDIDTSDFALLLPSSKTFHTPESTSSSSRSSLGPNVSDIPLTSSEPSTYRSISDSTPLSDHQRLDRSDTPGLPISGLSSESPIGSGSLSSRAETGGRTTTTSSPAKAPYRCEICDRTFEKSWIRK